MKGFHNRNKGIGITFDDIYILNGARTGFGKLGGSLSYISPTDLGIFAAKAAMERAGVDPSEIDQVVFSNITPSSIDAYYLPRHVGLYSGIPVSVPAILVQRLCGSGFETVITAAEQISMGKAALILSGAGENMTLSPTVSFGNRLGYALGQVLFQDFLAEALKDSAIGGHMGCTAENLVTQYKITRNEVDEFAVLSQERAIAGKDRLREEMVALNSTTFNAPGLNPRNVRMPKGVVDFAADENVRATSMEALAKLKPAFTADGVQTGGNSSGIVDGGAALVVGSGQEAKAGKKTLLAKVIAATSSGVDPNTMGIGPVPSIRYLMEITGMKLDQVGLIEINEAFAGQFIACERELGFDRKIANVNGGAIALGHPLSVSGARILLSLGMEMKRRNVKYGIGSACVGGGQGTAVLLENPDFK